MASQYGPGPSTAAFPLRLGDPADFARVAKALRVPDFSEAAVHRTLRAIGQTVLGPEDLESVPDAGAQPSPLLQLFVELKAIPREELERVMDRATLDSFLALDLIRANGEMYESPVFVYPVGEMLIASDHYNGSMAGDCVFPAIQSGTLHLLKLMPRSAVGDALDLCCGTAICGLMLSRNAKRVTACDVTERAGHFARFNLLLNECSNVEIAIGDLYSPVEGRMFDRIVTHPPYVPSLDQGTIWRDGGSTGEAITRRIVEELPGRLKPGGVFFALCLGNEQEDVAYQQRVRGWLGEAESEFDILLATQKLLSPTEMARQAAAKDGPGEPAERAAKFERAFREAGVTRFCYGAVAIRRHDRPGVRPWTMRTKLGSDTEAAAFETVFQRSRECAQPGALEKMRPRLAPQLKATLAHAVEESRFAPSELVLETEIPFEQRIRLQASTFPLFEFFDGRSTTAEAFEKARSAQILPEGCEFQEFASLVAMLAIQGYLDYGE